MLIKKHGLLCSLFSYFTTNYYPHHTLFIILKNVAYIYVTGVDTMDTLKYELGD